MSATAACSAFLKAPSKKFVDECFMFVQQNGNLNDEQIAALTISAQEAKDLVTAIKYIVTTSVRDNLQPTDITALFEPDFEKKLKELVAAIVTAHLNDWRQPALDKMITLPRYFDVDWRIDLKTASDSSFRIAQPTALVQLQILDNPTHVDNMPQIRNVTFELSKENLSTMIDGLGKIRDQLNKIK